MKRIASLAIVATMVMSAGVNWTSAKSAIRASDLLEVLPDGNAVVVIDFQKIAGSSLWATINAQEKFKSAIDKAQSEMTELGVKLNEVHTVALVFPAGSLSNPTIAVTGGFQQSDLLAGLRASEKVKLRSEKYKDFDVYNVESIGAMVPPTERAKETNPSKSQSATGDRLAAAKGGTWFVFRDPNTIVAGSLEAVRASIDVRKGVQKGIAQNGKLAEAVAQNPTAAIRFAIAVTPAMTTGLQSSQLPIPDFSSVRLVFGAIDVGSGVDLIATLRSDSPEHAKAIAERLNGLLGMAKGYLGSMNDAKMTPIVEALKTVNIVSADVDVKITGSVPMDLLNSLLSSFLRKVQ